MSNIIDKFLRLNDQWTMQTFIFFFSKIFSSTLLRVKPICLVRL